MISWLGHLLVVLAVALFVCPTLRRSGPEVAQATLRFAWIPLLAAATDPLLTFVSRKLWIDSLMTGLAALSIALVHLALHSRHRRVLLILGGIVLGLAGLAKVPALLVAPIAALLVWADGGPLRRRLADVAWIAGPSLALTLPWFAWFYSTYGVITPQWLEPDAYALQHYPFVAAAVGRPWYYYATKLCIAQPLLPVLLLLQVRDLRAGLQPERWIPLAWLIWLLGVATVQGATGYGFQMRYVVPVLPALYIGLLAQPRLAAASETWWGRPLIWIAIVYSAMGGVLYLLTPRYDEFLTLLELGGLLAF